MKLLPLIPLLAPLIAAADVATAHEFPWGSVSANGLLCWYLWYQVRHAGPNTQQHYERIIKEVETRHDKRHDELVDLVKRLGPPDRNFG